MLEHKFQLSDPAQKVHFQYTFVIKPEIVEIVGHFDCSKWDFQVGKRFSGSVGCIDSAVPPKSSKSELHMLSQYPGKDHFLVAEAAQFHHQVQTFSKKGSGEEKLAS